MAADHGTMLRVLLGILVAALCVASATALRCYSCSGFTCSYGFFSFVYPEMECQAKSGNSILDAVTSIIPTQCVKITGKFENGDSFVARNCSTYTSQAGCNLLASAMELGSNLKDLECYTCTSDLCNSASRFSGVAAIGLVIACLAFLF